MTREIAYLTQPCRQTQALLSQTHHISVRLSARDQIQALPLCVTHKSVLRHTAHLSAAFISPVQLGHSTWGHGTGRTKLNPLQSGRGGPLAVSTLLVEETPPHHVAHPPSCTEPLKAGPGLVCPHVYLLPLLHKPSFFSF